MTEQLKNELVACLKAGRDIAARAEDAGRGFYPEERIEVDRLIAKSKTLKKRIQDQDLRDQIDALGGFCGAHESTSQVGGGSWADAFEKALDRRYGQKELVPSGTVTVPALSETLTPLGDERVDSILQLIPMRPLDGTDSFAYLRETVQDHQAAPVAVGAKKPTSIYSVEKVEDRVRTIAHLSEPIPRQYLADIPLLRQYLNGVLLEGFLLEYEYQVIEGPGSGENVTGLLATSGILTQAYDSDLLTTTRRAITQLERLSIPPGAFCFHPADWEAFELLSSGEGRFLLGDAREGGRVIPVDRAKRRLWGLPVALSLGMPEGRGVLADFVGSTARLEREGVRVDWSESAYNPPTYDEEGSSDFERNLVRFRCEGRVGFAVLRPAGVVSIALESGS